MIYFLLLFNYIKASFPEAVQDTINSSDFCFDFNNHFLSVEEVDQYFATIQPNNINSNQVPTNLTIVNEIQECFRKVLIYDINIQEMSKNEVSDLKNLGKAILQSFCTYYCQESISMSDRSLSEINDVIKYILPKMQSFIDKNISLIKEIQTYNLKSGWIRIHNRKFSCRSIKYDYIGTPWDRFWVNNTKYNICKRIKNEENCNEVYKSLILSKIINLSINAEKKILVLMFIYILNMFENDILKDKLLRFNLYIDCYYYNNDRISRLASLDNEMFVENKIKFYFQCACIHRKFYEGYLRGVLQNLRHNEIMYLKNKDNNDIVRAYLIYYGFMIPYYVQNGYLYRFPYLNDVASRYKQTEEYFSDLYELPIKILDHIMAETGLFHD